MSKVEAEAGVEAAITATTTTTTREEFEIRDTIRKAAQS